MNRELGLEPERPYFSGFSPEGLPSPCYVVDRAALQFNLDILARVAAESGATILAALKAFSFFALFDQVSASLSGACASGIHEARLAREHIGKEVHVYAPAYKDIELEELLETSDHIVFNNLHQWYRFRDRALSARERQQPIREAPGRQQLSFGIRINPEHSEGTVPIYDPCAPASRLGTTRRQWNDELQGEFPEGISGLHFHTLCEQGSEPLERTLEAVEQGWGDILSRREIRWLNMGGGHHISKADYNRKLLVELVKRSREKWGLKIYLEPGEAVAIHTGILVSRVTDIHYNRIALAILDTSATCHMPDVLEMPYTPAVWGAVAEPNSGGPLQYRLAGGTCLAGDLIGDYRFNSKLEVGDPVIFDDMAHYTMVKTSTFNGIPLPSLAVWDSRDGSLRIIRRFAYEDFRSRLS
jgi:carboxynorspermidine decarboxylase